MRYTWNVLRSTGPRRLCLGFGNCGRHRRLGVWSVRESYMRARCWGCNMVEVANCYGLAQPKKRKKTQIMGLRTNSCHVRDPHSTPEPAWVNTADQVATKQSGSLLLDFKWPTLMTKTTKYATTKDEPKRKIRWMNICPENSGKGTEKPDGIHPR